MKLIALKHYLEQGFAAGSAPHENTARRLIRDGVLPGRRLGFRYYVDALALEVGFDPIVIKVMNDVRRAS